MARFKRSMLTPKIEARFWAKVDKRGPDECWPWIAYQHSFGYGTLTIQIDGRGYPVCSHVLSYVIANGDVPEGKLVRHSCDNPPCCNPVHLLAGSQKENLADMSSHGRGATGDRNGSRLYPERLKRGHDVFGSKLTEMDVRVIRRLVGEMTFTAIGNVFGCSRVNVANIVKGKVWKSVSC